MRKVQKYGFVLAGIFLVWLSAYAFVKPNQGTGRVVEDFKELPMVIGQWKGIDGPLDTVSRQALPNCALLNRDYQDEQGYDVNLTIVYGVDLGSFHQPEYCLEGQGWKRISSQQVVVRSTKPHNATMMTMASDYQQIVVAYWFASESDADIDLGKLKKNVLWDRLKKGKLKPCAMIRLIALVDGDLWKAKLNVANLATGLDPHIHGMLSEPPVYEVLKVGLGE